jgi:hypothetical protein
MNKNLTVTKLVLGIMVATLVGSPALAAPRKSNRTVTGPVPIGYSVNQGGMFHNNVLPGGTVTGPLGPEVNGG